MDKIHIHNEYNLGDHIYQLRWCTKAVDSTNIEINYYCPSKFHNDINNLLSDKYKSNIHIRELNDKPEKSFNTWINYNKIYSNFVNLSRMSSSNMYYDKMYLSVFGNISKHLNIENPIKTIDDLLFDDERLLKENELSDKVDLLLINSKPMSGQYTYDENNFNRFISKYKDQYKIVTTNHSSFSDIPCTLDYNLSLIDIGNLSNNAKIIVSVHTSPIIYCFNKFNINKDIKWYVLHNFAISYSFNNNIFSLPNIINVVI